MKRKNAKIAGIGYTVGNILIRGLSFITLPIFTRLMSTGEYGLYSTYLSYEGILTLCVGLGLHASIKSAKIEFKERVDTYVSTVVFLPIGLAILISFLSIPFVEDIAGYFDFSKNIVYLMLFQAVASSIVSIYNARLSLEYSYVKYLVISLVSALSNVFLSLWLMIVVMPGQNFYARVLSTACPLFVIAAFILLSFIKKAKPEFKGDLYKFGLKFSLPLVPHGVSQLILSQFGKIIIQKRIGNAAAGIYGFSYTIALIPQVLISSFDTVWGTWFFEEFNKNNFDMIKERATQYVALFSAITCGLIGVSPEMIKVLGDSDYWSAINIVIPVLLGVYFTFLYTLPAQIEYFYKKTKFIAIGTVFAALLNVTLCLILVPKYGYELAVYITLLTYIIYFVAHLFIAKMIAKKDFPIVLKWLILYIVGVFVFSTFAHIFREEWIIRYLLCFVTVLIIGLINKSEIIKIIKSLKGGRTLSDVDIEN